MNSPPDPATIAFEGDRRIAAGDLREVARAAKATLDRQATPRSWSSTAAPAHRSISIFAASIDDVLARLPATPTRQPRWTPHRPRPRGPGRPKLGVVAREITLLPRHWDWLAQQRGGASVAIRRLVEQARRGGEDKDRIRARRRRRPIASCRRWPATGRISKRRSARCSRHDPPPFRKIDRRMARRRARPCLDAGGTGTSTRSRRRDAG